MKENLLCPSNLIQEQPIFALSEQFDPKSKQLNNPDEINCDVYVKAMTHKELMLEPCVRQKAPPECQLVCWIIAACSV